MPCAAGVSTSSAPSRASILRRSIDIDLGHHQDQPIAARGGDEGERDAGVAGGRLDQRRAPGVMLPCASSASIIDDADAVLDAGDRIEELELGEELGVDALLLAAIRSMRTRGVSPIVSVIES